MRRTLEKYSVAGWLLSVVTVMESGVPGVNCKQRQNRLLSVNENRGIRILSVTEVRGNRIFSVTQAVRGRSLKLQWKSLHKASLASQLKDPSDPA